MLSQEEFNAAVEQCGFPIPSPDQFAIFIAEAQPLSRITDKRELAMFLANILLESDGLRTKREYNPPPNAYVYPPLDVPGKLYYGRGYIQLTW